MTKPYAELSAILRKDEATLLAAWAEEQLRHVGNKISANELKFQCQDFLRLFAEAVQRGEFTTGGTMPEPIRQLLNEISKSRGQQGFSPGETATFIFSLKKPLFASVRAASDQPEHYADTIWYLTEILDQLGLYTTEAYQKSREDLIIRQQEEMLELSTPVVKLWDGILALPMIGTLDSNRTQVVMESLLQKIVDTGSEIAILDITGVPTVDTLVAQHLIKTVTAARLMGAECIISGIRPQIAATIVHLGVELNGVTTKASLADAFRLALQKTGRMVVTSAGTAGAVKRG